MKLYVVLVSPAMSDQLDPPLVLTCHWTVGVGLPVAAEVKLTVSPGLTVWLVGFVVTDGANSTLSVAKADVAVPYVLVKTARYCLPLSSEVAVKL